jgi:hypothetical protein
MDLHDKTFNSILNNTADLRKCVEKLLGMVDLLHTRINKLEAEVREDEEEFE